MLELLKCLHDAGHHLLLYTQNIKKISMFHIPEAGDTTNIEEWFTFEKELVKVIRDIGCNFAGNSRTAKTICSFEKRYLYFRKLQKRKIYTRFQSKTRLGQIHELESSSVLKIDNMLTRHCMPGELHRTFRTSQ